MTPQPAGAIDWAAATAQAVVDGGVLPQMLSVITTGGADRTDVVFGISLIGLALGAGACIGWELTRWLVQTARRRIPTRVDHRHEPAPPSPRDASSTDGR